MMLVIPEAVALEFTATKKLLSHRRIMAVHRATRSQSIKYMVSINRREDHGTSHKVPKEIGTAPLATIMHHFTITVLEHKEEETGIATITMAVAEFTIIANGITTITQQVVDVAEGLEEATVEDEVGEVGDSMVTMEEVDLVDEVVITNHIERGQETNLETEDKPDDKITVCTR
mmetsp:Transcript_11898/g.20944  ORF Transcript_11898/g.20944 Transcript_11898/m.20944 type:complete len:174 (+) Transcript_11898:223-744(+)